MTDREQELANDPNVLRLVKGDESVWVSKGGADEKLWRAKGFALESETVAAKGATSAAEKAPPAASKTSDSGGAAADADRSKKDR